MLHDTGDMDDMSLLNDLMECTYDNNAEVCMYACICMHVCMECTYDNNAEVCMYACMYAHMYGMVIMLRYVCMHVCMHVCME